jgi:hypothetical protein
MEKTYKNLDGSVIMILSILYWYVIISYTVGVIIYFAELPTLLRAKGDEVFFATVLVLFASLIAWHGALHYAQRWFCKLTGRPVKYWI